MISIANSIKFRKVDGLLASFDNTFSADEPWLNTLIIDWCQPVDEDDELTLQVKVTSGYTAELFVSENFGAWTSLGSGTLAVDGAVYDYYEFAIDFGTLTASPVRFKVEISDTTPAVTETWLSEPAEMLADVDDLYLWEFWNEDTAFEVDYTTDIVHQLRVAGRLKEYNVGGESTVFDNQNEVTKIYQQVKRILRFQSELMPLYMAEMLYVATAHDHLFINEVEYVAEDKPEIENLPNNLCTFTINLTQRNVIGLNTHDIGYDCDAATNTETMVLQELSASGAITFTVPDGYLILTITGYRTAGSPVIKAGTTPGGDEVLYGMSLSTSPVWEVAAVNQEIAPTGDATLYVDISGVGATANVYVLIVNNRQS
jgi:hypothetical protein